ncbi:activating molecule in BECN1-regulated autophagy protein 1-like [Colias croceus]|uniref:activating molecule in BECN1-regulated autophagy protein 1-like n=1 Tax=Colias crocea TaxID=72248 RepID=UPI001E27EEC1|nr:activating molecule in BECN1-regulated autophagy protein 1-like [Colias croceus]
MDPIIDPEWLGSKNDQIDEAQNIGNIARSWQWRERGVNPLHSPSNKTVLENVAEDILVQKPLKIRCCDLPGYPRSTFLMVFSPDGTKVASTHGNHNVYVSELASGKHVRILKGHPRTPWCIAFHPSHPQLIGSGCLGGQVRVWDISSGGSEVWSVQKETVIASIAFHPREQLLVIATYNELYFWDWSQPAPFTKVSTNNINEKVRYVAFDSLGYKLITGISLWTSPGGHTSLLQRNTHSSPPHVINYRRRDDPDENPGNNRSQDSPGPTRDVIVNSYQNLVQRYDSLVRNYQRLFMVRHRLTATTPPPSTTDRGTDPMETDPTPEANGYTRMARPNLSTLLNFDDDDPVPGTSNRQDNAENTDVEANSSRLLNLDALSFGSDPSRDQNTTRQESSIFGSRPSAFQPLGESSRTSLWSASQTDQSERVTRLLPNPFSSTNGTPRPSRVSFTSSPLNNQDNESTAGSSRTRSFPGHRSESPLLLDLSLHRCSPNPSNNNQNENPITIDNDSSFSSSSLPNTSASSSAHRTSNSIYTQARMSTPVDAQTINESLDLIRDILRDSGTRLLNLITNMSLSTLTRAERNIQRRENETRAHSDDSDGVARTRNNRPRPRLFSGLHQNTIFLSSSSESDSDNPPEVNIFRTRNSTFREDNTRDTNRQTSSSNNSNRLENPTDRLVFELNNDLPVSDNVPERSGLNVSSNSRRFHVRIQNAATDEGTSTSTSTRNNDEPSENRNQNSNFDPNMPSTSRDNFWSSGNTLSSDEAFRKVRSGVNALQKHAQQLANFWLRGQRISMRDLRNMWENLRRRILMLHRETGRQDVTSYYTRSLLERCMMLTEVTDNVNRGSSRTRSSQRSEDRNSETNRDASNNSDTPENEQSTTPDNTNDNRQSSRTSQTRSSSGGRYSPFVRRRLQPNYRWRHDDDLRRRTRNSASNRLSQRYNNRPRREFARAIEISATRHEIRMRAMQVLSVMFNMMMMCLEERGLSQLIINMLRTLKKALAITCLMLMSNRNSGRTSASNNQSPQRSDNRNTNRVDNNEATTSNTNEQSECTHYSISSETEEERTRGSTSTNRENSTTSASGSNANNTQDDSPVSSPNSVTQRWSNRLAVLIAAANRNNSATARSRRELYQESRRLKALHRTNPTAHPLIKKRAFPPVATHRIPVLRSLPRKNIKTPSTPRIGAANPEPVAGPSRFSTGENPNQEPSRLPPEVMNEFEHRINLIRIAHMQAVRLRNVARSRYRRLQTIRLYTPSSVREMFTLQENNENQQGNPSPLQNNADQSSRRPSFDGRSPILGRERIFPRLPMNAQSEDSGPLHAVISNAALSLLQVNDPDSPEEQGNQQQRLPRIHEYLQPIILAQNAMADEDGNGDGAGGGPAEGNGIAGIGARRMSGMAGLLDAGIISETFPAPSHRVQAWDFTKGDTPDIADSSKNVVVQRCRIHNDASIDISKDGRLLVALLPVPRLRNTNHWLGVYSLEWSRLGQCLHTAVLEQSAVSVALSPTARHLAVGLGSRRFTSVHHARTNVFALLYRLDPLESSSRTGLSPIKELEQTWEHGFTSLNCLRWAPQPGQGLVYANNTGQLIIMS